MCRYVDNDVILGNLFIKVIEQELDEITFNKIYDFVYYTSLKLNEEENTLILVSRESIMSFVECYKELICIEKEDSIKVMKKEESIQCFKNRYEENGEEYADAFNYAMLRLAA